MLSPNAPEGFVHVASNHRRHLRLSDGIEEHGNRLGGHKQGRQLPASRALRPRGGRADERGHPGGLEDLAGKSCPHESKAAPLGTWSLWKDIRYVLDTVLPRGKA